MADSQAWLEWIERRAQQRDTLRSIPNMPSTPDLPAYRLHEFKRHISDPLELRYEPPGM